MSVSRHHADWLALVEVSGPFVSLPVLLRVFPQGLDPRDPAQAKALRTAHDEWHDNPAAPGKHRAWVLHVLTAVLGYRQDQITEGQKLPAGLTAEMPEMGETLRPDFALVGPAGSDTAGQAQLLIASYTVEQALDKPVIGKHWKATPATRMMELLHGAGVSLGLVTNGEHWMLVYAPRGETTGYASWYGSLWLDEPITLRAFHSLLGVRRFFGVATGNTLLALLKESASDQQEVTDQLGYQVREAVKVLVQCFDALDKESNRVLLAGVNPPVLYDAALTIMMRLVFLFSAEERGLLHLGKPLYDNNYAVSTLQEQLQEVADRYGEEVLERRTDAWARLLASFRAVHSGIKHQDLLMQAYGGSLFDPDRYPFLEGRAAGSGWRSTPAEPLAVNNRVVLHLLNSLQRLRIKVGVGGTAETRRISFRALGVEQIGHVYEGLLDHTGVRATKTVLGIKGTRNKKPEIPLATLESLLAQGQDKLIDFLKEETGKSLSALRKTLEESSLLDEHKLLVACGHDEPLLARLRPFASLIREDSFERPLLVLDGSVYVTAGTTRRSTGTHYTPPSLTEPIVQHTLEPLVYEGPAEGSPREQWKLKSPKAILDLKVCDMAMGSGAFLVQACRYLAERLTEAWENEEKQHPGQVLITPDGRFSEGVPSERLVPADANERIAIARRVVADRCLYGVDINPMAVEMAKLSLWLITVDASRPFTFLDHAFKCGDSLLGVTSLDQLEHFSMGQGKHQLTFARANLFGSLKEASSKRRALEDTPTNMYDQIVLKSRLNAEAEAMTAIAKALADCLVAFELRGAKLSRGDMRDAAAEQAELAMRKSLPEFRAYADSQLGGERSRPFHWLLEFSEVLERGGFSAVLTNPPFGEGAIISEVENEYYRRCFKVCSMSNTGSPSQTSKINLASLFVERVLNLVAKPSSFGFVAPKPILRNERYWRVRQVLLEHACPLAVFSFPSGAFSAASVEPCAFVGIRRAAPTVREDAKYTIIDNSNSTYGQDSKFGRLSDVLSDERYTIRIESDGGLIDLCSRIERVHSLMESAFETKDGVNPGRKDFRSVFLGKKIDNNFVPLASLGGNTDEKHWLAQHEPFDHEIHKPTINGRDFDSFSSINWDSTYLRYDPKVAYVEDFFVKGTRWSAQLREKEHYDRPIKVVSRQTASTLIATIDDRHFFPLNTVHVHYPKKGQSAICCIALAGILNSSLLRFIYKIKSEEVGKVFPQVHISRLRSLPLPSNPPQDRLEMVRRTTALLLQGGAARELLSALDFAVFEIYQISAPDRATILASLDNSRRG